MLDDEAYYEQTARNDAMQMLQLGNTRGRLVIDCVTSDHAGTYTCVAQTPTERIASQTYLEVGEFTTYIDHGMHADNLARLLTPNRGILLFLAPYFWQPGFDMAHL